MSSKDKSTKSKKPFVFGWSSKKEDVENTMEEVENLDGNVENDEDVRVIGFSTKSKKKAGKKVSEETETLEDEIDNDIEALENELDETLSTENLKKAAASTKYKLTYFTKDS